jgi:hypothetical protein
VIYYDTENRNKFMEAIKEEARILGIDLVTRDLDRFYMYYADRYKTLDSLIERIVGDIRGWFSDNRLSKKEICVAVGTEPWAGEHVRIQTRRKR